MGLGGATAMPEQPECGGERQLPTPVPATACLQRQALGLGLAPALVLTIMGQLSKRFVVQHVHPSFQHELACLA
jgi:hypothetical protein